MIDYLALKQALADMKPRQKVFELVKNEMKRRGHWKNLDRGAKPPRRTTNG